jgi:hypothetical protein
VLSPKALAWAHDGMAERDPGHDPGQALRSMSDRHLGADDDSFGTRGKRASPGYCFARETAVGYMSALATRRSSGLVRLSSGLTPAFTAPVSGLVASTFIER